MTTTITGIKPTSEQMAIREDARANPLASRKIIAGAGTGKTSTLKMLAQDRDEPGVYLAFNTSVKREAEGHFPKHVKAYTAHSAAYEALRVGQSSLRQRMNGRLFGSMVKKIIDIPVGRLPQDYLGQIAVETVSRFCNSAEKELSLKHVALDPREPEDIREAVLETSQKLWGEMSNRKGTCPINHDTYLKLWHLADGEIKGNPKWGLFDEAQDASPVMLDIMQRQGIPITYVGDSHQSIYQWRGAIDAMKNITGVDEFPLSQSFRFGKDIADVANMVLGQKESDLKSRFQLVGNPNRNSLIGKIPRNEKHAYITRTNAEWFHEALRFKGRVHVIGDIEQTVRVLESAHYLWKGLHHSSKAPQIARFQTWRELCNHSEQFEDREMIFARRIIEQYKDILPGAIVDLRNRHCQNEQDADLILSTAHKAKGREFSLVRLSNGFVSPLSKEWADMSESSREAEINLLYVALTRSIDALEPGNSILDCLAIAKGECQQAQKGQETKRPKHEPLPQLAVPPYKVMKIEVAKPEVVINQGLEIPPVKVAKPQFGHIDDFLGEENINSIDVLNVSKVRNMETVIVEEKVQMKEHKPVGDEVVVKPLGGKKRQEINARKAKEAEKNSAITISVMPPKASSRNRNKTPTPWTPEDDQKIYDLAIKGIKIESIARQVKRKPMGVLIRLAFLSVPGYDNQYICSEVLSAMMPSGKSIVRAGI